MNQITPDAPVPPEPVPAPTKKTAGLLKMLTMQVVSGLIGAIAVLLLSYITGMSGWVINRIGDRFVSITAATVLANLEFEVQNIIVNHRTEKGKLIQTVECKNSYKLIFPICQWESGNDKGNHLISIAKMPDDKGAASCSFLALAGSDYQPVAAALCARSKP